MRSICFGVVLYLLCVGAGAAPPCAGDKIADAKALAVSIASVRPDGTLVLRDGRTVRLSGLHADDVGAHHETVKQLTTGKTLGLYGYTPRTDRYGRLRAQVVAGETWVQQAMIEQGLARVEIMPDRTECAAELLRAEDQARRRRIGIWSLPAYAIRTPETVGAFVGSFQIVEGRVINAARKDGRVFLNFGPNWKTDFTATLAPADSKAFRHRAFDPMRLLGSRIRVRGTVQSYRGPEIEVYGPEQIEVLD